MELEAFEVSKMLRPPYLLLSWLFLGFHFAWRVAFQHAISRVCKGSLSHSPGRRTEQLAASVGGSCQTSVKTVDFEQAAFGQAKTCPPPFWHGNLQQPQFTKGPAGSVGAGALCTHTTQHAPTKPGQVFLEVL